MNAEAEQGIKRKECPRCPTGAGMWMATFSDMAILLMAMFVLLIALAETAKKRDSMFSVAGDAQSAYGTQDEVESDLAPSGGKGSSTNSDTNEGYDIIVKSLAKEIDEGTVGVIIKDERIIVNVSGADSPGSSTAKVQQAQLEIYMKVAEAQRDIKVAVNVSQDSEGTTSDGEAWEAMFSAQYRKIRQKLDSAIKSNQVEVIRDGDKIIVRLASEGSFKSGSADLQDGFGFLLNDVGDALIDVKGLITIEGHTDNIPISSFGSRFRSNWDLSAGRSGAVADYLLTKYSFKTGLMVSGLADTKPIMSNNTNEGRAKNRRIELIVDGSY
tara:strand:+ start:2753 stop:3733 length:981 start_codon:yes stop_codon:yes gene_type:complete